MIGALIGPANSNLKNYPKIPKDYRLILVISKIPTLVDKIIIQWN